VLLKPLVNRREKASCGVDGYAFAAAADWIMCCALPNESKSMIAVCGYVHVCTRESY
jgi:hypothetical protein